jgi:hypothetical protein
VAESGAEVSWTLRERERHLIDELAVRRSALRSAREELAELRRALELGSKRLERERRNTELRPSDRRRPLLVKLLLTIGLVPLAAAGGAFSASLAWALVALPLFPLAFDPEWPLAALAVLVTCSALIGITYALLRIWR